METGDFLKKILANTRKYSTSMWAHMQTPDFAQSFAEKQIPHTFFHFAPSSFDFSSLSLDLSLLLICGPNLFLRRVSV